MKILVLGAKGMAGHVIYKRLQDRGYSVIGTSRYADHYADASILKFDAAETNKWVPFFDVFKNSRFDLIVNCIGVLVKTSKEHPWLANTVNTVLPKFLETHFKSTSTKIIHISTDCVFDGKRGDYAVWEKPNETDNYGRSKAFGELKNSKDLTIRTSIIGLELNDKSNASDNCGLIHWFLSQPKGSTIQGYSQCFWSGISTLELADAIEWYIDHPLNGIHQVSRATKTSKYRLLTLANDVFERDLVIEDDATKVVDKSLIPSTLGYTVENTYADMLSRMNLHLAKYGY